MLIRCTGDAMTKRVDYELHVLFAQQGSRRAYQPTLITHACTGVVNKIGVVAVRVDVANVNKMKNRCAISRIF